MKKIINILILIIFLLVFVITFLPSLLSFINLYRDRNIMFNSNKYENRNIMIDSILDDDQEGATGSDIYGYSKTLDNYNTKIIFGFVNDDSYKEKLGLDSKDCRHVWLRKGHKYGYPASKFDKKYPIKHELFT